MNLKELRQRKAKKVKAAQKILDDAGDNDLTEDQAAEFDSIQAEITSLNAQIERAEFVQGQELALDTVGDTSEPTDINTASNISVGADPTKEYANMGEFLQDVAAVEIAGQSPSGKFETYMAATGHSTGVGHDGGFLVRHDWSTALMDRGRNASALYPRCTRIPVGAGADGVEFPFIDETSRADGSRGGGVVVYRRAEAGTVTAAKVKFGKTVLELEDLMALSYATDRSLRDATSLQSIIETEFASEFAYKLDNEILRGNGAGQCLGILASNELVSVSAETGQTAATIQYENVSKMRARLPARSRSNAVWLINQDAEPELQNMVLVIGTGGVPVYLPAGGASTEPYDRLFGRPVIPIEQASTVGTIGDLVLADLSKYIIIEKGGIRADESMHVRFIYGEKCFRWMYSVNGMPRPRSSFTPANGSNTQSPFVALATRS